MSREHREAAALVPGVGKEHCCIGDLGRQGRVCWVLVVGGAERLCCVDFLVSRGGVCCMDVLGRPKGRLCWMDVWRFCWVGITEGWGEVCRKAIQGSQEGSAVCVSGESKGRIC